MKPQHCIANWKNYLDFQRTYEFWWVHVMLKNALWCIGNRLLIICDDFLDLKSHISLSIIFFLVEWVTLLDFVLGFLWNSCRERVVSSSFSCCSWLLTDKTSKNLLEKSPHFTPKKTVKMTSQYRVSINNNHYFDL